MDWRHERGIAMSHHLLPGEWSELHDFDSAYRGTDGPLDIGIGRFTNSEGNESVFGGLRYENGPFWAESGAVTGYSGADVLPFGRNGDGTLGSVLGFNLQNWTW